MKAVRILVVLIAVCLIAPSCSEPPASPAVPGPEADRSGSLRQPAELLQCSDLPFDSETRTIGPAGGSITAGLHTLLIPPGALDARTRITMSVRTGRGVNAVHFEPEGLKFARSATLTMSYANCNLLGRLLPKRIAYADDALNVISYLLSLDNQLGKRVTGGLDHFSDYVIAW